MGLEDDVARITADRDLAEAHEAALAADRQSADQKILDQVASIARELATLFGSRGLRPWARVPVDHVHPPVLGPLRRVLAGSQAHQPLVWCLTGTTVRQLDDEWSHGLLGLSTEGQLGAVGWRRGGFVSRLGPSRRQVWSGRAARRAMDRYCAAQHLAGTYESFQPWTSSPSGRDGQLPLGPTVFRLTEGAAEIRARHGAVFTPVRDFFAAVAAETLAEQPPSPRG